MTTVPAHFSDQVFESAKNFLEAAERCGEPRPTDDGAVNALLRPSEHCAVLACELFMKSVFVDPVYEPINGSNVLSLRAEPVARRHQDFMRHLKNSRIARELWDKLDPSEQALLESELQSKLTSSRYPYEKNAQRYDDAPLKLARKLKELIEGLLAQMRMETSV